MSTTRATRTTAGSDKAELQLWCAVLLSVIEDAQREVTHDTDERTRVDILAARDYLTKPNRDFTMVCSLSGLDPMAVRDRLLLPFTKPVAAYPDDQTRGRPASLYAYNGETLTLDQWSTRTGINVRTIYSRLKIGWPIERALAEPVGRRRSRWHGPGVGNDFRETRGTGAPHTTHSHNEIEFSE